MTELAHLLLHAGGLDAALGAARKEILLREERLALLDASRIILSSRCEDFLAGGSILLATAVSMCPLCFLRPQEGTSCEATATDLPGCEAFLTDMNNHLKKLQMRQAAAAHAAKLKAESSAHMSRDSEARNVSSSTRHTVDRIVLEQSIACLLRLKKLILVGLAVAGMPHDVQFSFMRKVASELWESNSAIVWLNSSKSLEQAEREFDETLAMALTPGDATVGALAQVALAKASSLSASLSAETIVRESAQPYAHCCARLVDLPALPLQPVELRCGLTTSLPELLMVDSTEAPLAEALRAACRGKLLHDDSEALRAKLRSAAENSLERGGVRAQLLKRFLQVPGHVAQLVERNKDIAVALFMLRTHIDASSAAGHEEGALLRVADFDQALDAVFQTLDIGEPLCHLVKSLADNEELRQPSLEAFVVACLVKIDRDHNTGEDAKAQRGAKLLALLLNNLLMRRRERLLSPEVEATLCEALVRMSKVRECAELYSTLCTFRKSRQT